MDDGERVLERLDLLLQRQAELAARVSALQDQVTRLGAQLSADEDTTPNPSPAAARVRPVPAGGRPLPRPAGPARPPVQTFTPAPRAPAGPPAGPPVAHPAQPVADYDLPTLERHSPAAQRIPAAGPPPGQRLTPPAVEPPPADTDHGGLIAKIFAFVGAGVLLLGIGLLLVLAAQAGFFGPVAQVVSVAVLAGLLLGAAFWLRSRSPIGSVTLAAVAFAAGYLDIAAITGVHQWVPRPVGLVIAGAIALAGLLLGRWWRSGALATIVSLGVLILVPLISPNNTTSLAFMIGFAIVSLAATWGMGWAGPQLARLVPLALFAVVAAFGIGRTDPDLGLMLGATVVLVLIGVVEAVAARFSPLRADDAAPTMPGHPRSAHLPGDEPTGVHPVLATIAASCLVVLVLPSLILGVRLGADLGAVLLVGLGVGLLGVSLVWLVPDSSRGVAAAAAALWTPIGVVQWLPDEWWLSPLLVMGPVMMLVALLRRSTLHGWVGVIHSGVTVAVTVLWVPRLMLSTDGALAGFPADAVHAVLAIGTLVMLREVVRRLAWPPADWARYRGHVLDVVLWVAGLALLSGALVGFATWVGSELAEDMAGFRVGHGLVTIGWFLAAGFALVTGLRPGPTAGTRRGFGLALAAIALTKLLLWDLSVLSGLVRVVVAIVTGLLLIGLGIWYARALERLRPATPEQPPVGPPTRQAVVPPTHQPVGSPPHPSSGFPPPRQPPPPGPG